MTMERDVVSDWFIDRIVDLTASVKVGPLSHFPQQMNMDYRVATEADFGR